MELAEVIEAEMNQVALRIREMFEPPVGSYEISIEDEKAAEDWIREWNRTGGHAPTLTPRLSRALWPRFLLALRFLRTGRVHGTPLVLAVENQHLLASLLLIEQWPSFRQMWQKQDSSLN
jgi:hypothetical protein